MTLDEFEAIEPVLARSLRWYTHNHIVDGVYQREDGRWEAHCAIAPWGDFEICLEARCRPGCQRGVGGPRTWVWEGHECCAACEADPSHHYQTVHE